MNLVRQYWKAALMGAAAFCLTWSLWHLWVDHEALHQIIAVLNQQAAAQQAQKAAGAK
jgi:hypothetical protein